ncbi:hypothetical protein [Nocardioides sp.]|uniref:hypothetical protein n=1 Tax=Nocardioides sp. TaxID=35761 RepID=UPI0027255046|nr:hypothetical protein [Nocardioides sp.]MDO9454794.1 hypothetical protein [Nocardioides sp.]
MSALGRLLAPLLLLPLLAVPTASATTSATTTHTRAANAGATQERARMCANGRPQKTITERLGDGPRGADINGAGLWHRRADTCIWTTVTGRLTVAGSQAIQVLYDTDPDRAGAEFYAFSYSPIDGDERRGSFLVGRVDGEWRYLDCAVYFFFRPGRDQVGMGLPKTCLGSPRKVRVKVQLWDIIAYRADNQWRGKADQIPNRRWSKRF